MDAFGLGRKVLAMTIGDGRGLLLVCGIALFLEVVAVEPACVTVAGLAGAPEDSAPFDCSSW